jgi:acetolactate synthase-1/2/3 large subunit
MRAADFIVRSLEAHGIERLYCVPGESYLALLDALHDSNRINTVVCRHESGAGFMAVAEAKATGRPACFAVSRGPGATNGSIAIHVAEQDALPVVMLVGQVARAERGRFSFQEVDYQQFFGGMAKAVWEVSDAEKLAEVMPRAFHTACQGVPGPVVIVLPEDMLSDAAEAKVSSPWPVARPGAADGDADRVDAMLAEAKRPVLIAGQVLRTPQGKAALAAFAHAHQVPVAVTWKNQDLFDNRDPLYAGHLGFGNPPRHRDLLARADLVIACGTRLGDVASQNFTFPAAPEPTQPLIHIYPDCKPIGRVFRTDLGIVADPAGILAALASRPAAHAMPRGKWAAEIARFIDGFMEFKPSSPGDGVDFGRVVMAIARHAPANATIITDAGNFSTWVHRHWRLTPDNLMLGAIGGAMGFAVPAACAASMIHPGRMTIAVVGDGGMLMTGQELATAMAQGAAPKIFLSDNGIYGTIRSHQEKHYPKRVSGTDLHNPDFTQWARSFGAHVVTIDKSYDIDTAVAAALAHEGASVVHVHSSRETLSAFTTLSALRGQ